MTMGGAKARRAEEISQCHEHSSIKQNEQLRILRLFKQDVVMLRRPMEFKNLRFRTRRVQ